MIYYGYIADDHISDEALDELYSCLKGDVGHHACYSASAYDPEASLLGIHLSGDTSLFNPVEVSGLRFEPTEKEVAALQKVYDSLSEETRALFSTEPKVYIFETTDD